MPSSNLNAVRLSKRGSIFLSVVILLTLVAAVGPVYGSVSPGTKVTASGEKLTLNFEVDGIADTVTCVEFTDNFVVISGERTEATIPPPTIAHCTDSFGPDQVDSSVTRSYKRQERKLDAGGCPARIRGMFRELCPRLADPEVRSNSDIVGVAVVQSDLGTR
jgi:hypothetical protein